MLERTTIDMVEGLQEALDNAGVPLGMILPMASPFELPSRTLPADGAEVGRGPFADLFAYLTRTRAGVKTSGSPVITGLTGLEGIQAGMPVSGAGVPAGATLASIDSATQVTLSAALTVTDTSDIVVAPWGVGDGVTTFNVPDGRAEALRGFDEGRGIDAGRVFGAWQADELRAHSHGSVTQYSGQQGYLAGANPHAGYVQRSNSYSTGTTGGVETRMRNITARFCIRY